MKTLTYFLITDCFPWRPVGFDALLSNPTAMNDCCTLEFRLGCSASPIIRLRTLLPHLSVCHIFSQRDLKFSNIPVQDKEQAVRKEPHNQLCSA